MKHEALVKRLTNKYRVTAGEDSWSLSKRGSGGKGKPMIWRPFKWVLDEAGAFRQLRDAIKREVVREGIKSSAEADALVEAVLEAQGDLRGAEGEPAAA